VSTASIAGSARRQASTAASSLVSEIGVGEPAHRQVDDRREERALRGVHRGVRRLEHGPEQARVRQLVGEVRARDQAVQRLQRVRRVAHHPQVSVDEDLGDHGRREQDQIALPVLGVRGLDPLEFVDHRRARDAQRREPTLRARGLGALLGEHDVIGLVGQRLGHRGPQRRIARARDVALEQPHAGRDHDRELEADLVLVEREPRGAQAARAIGGRGGEERGVLAERQELGQEVDLDC
jgi:hypothetical protein